MLICGIERGHTCDSSAKSVKQNKQNTGIRIIIERTSMPSATILPPYVKTKTNICIAGTIVTTEVKTESLFSPFSTNWMFNNIHDRDSWPIMIANSSVNAAKMIRLWWALRVTLVTVNAEHNMNYAKILTVHTEGTKVYRDIYS